MADMDLREVLAEAPCTLKTMPLAWCNSDGESKHPECILARLSQPDVLDEFERRAGDRILATFCEGTVDDRAVTCREALADMLGGES